jgi:hypothetical protein
MRRAGEKTCPAMLKKADSIVKEQILVCNTYVKSTIRRLTRRSGVFQKLHI